MELKKYIDITEYAEILHLTKFELAFCIFYFVLAFIICAYSTPRGSLFSPDSTVYVPAAETMYHAQKLLRSVPIYPALIAAGMVLGLTSEQSAGLVPIICYSLLGFPVFLLGKIIIRPTAGYIACIICLLCGKYLLFISTYAWTDMPYLLFSALTMLFLVIYSKYGTTSSITFAGIFALLTSLTRYIGITLILTGIIAIALYNKGLRKSIQSLIDYCLLSIIPFIIYIFIAPRYEITTDSSNPPIDVVILAFRTVAEQIFYDDYVPIILIIILFLIFAVGYLYLNHRLDEYVRVTIPLTSYILIYPITLILVTSSLWISVEGGLLDVRKMVQIYPYLVIIVVSAFFYVYDTISNTSYRHIFKIVSVIILICLLVQGANSLNSMANSIKTKSITAYSDRNQFIGYIYDYNLSTKDKIYVENTTSFPIFKMQLLKEHLSYSGLIRKEKAGVSILDNISIPSKSKSALSLEDLIKENKNLPIYIIVSFDVSKEYMKNSSKNICLCNPWIFSSSIIYKAKLRCNKSCSSDSMDNISFLSDMAEIFTARHDYPTALAFAANVTKLEPNDKNNWLREGNLLWLLKKYNESIVKYRAALSLDPQSRDAWMQLGDMQRLLKNYNASLQSYRKVLEIDSNNTTILSNMADDYTNLKDYSNASAVAANITKFDPENKANWLREGNLLGLQKRYNESINKYDRALALDPHYKDALVAKGRVLSQLNNYNDSLEAYDKAIDLDPTNKDAWIGKAQVLGKMDNFNGSIEAYNKAIDINPKNPSTWITKGNALENKRKYNESLRAYDAALQLDPNNKNAWIAKGRVLSQLGNYNESLEAYDKAIDLDPNNKDILIARTKILDKIGNLNKSKKA